MVCDPLKSSVFGAVDSLRAIPVNLFRAIKRVSLVALIAGLITWAVLGAEKFLPAVILPSFLAALDQDRLRGLVYVSFASWASSLIILLFVEKKLMRAGKKLGKTINHEENILEYLDFNAARIFKRTFSFDHLPFERLLFYLILSSSDVAFSLDRLSVNRADLKQRLLDAMKERSKSFSRDNAGLVKEMNRQARRDLLRRACEFAIANGSEKVTIFDLFLILSERDRDFQKMMDTVELLKEDVKSVFLWQKNLENYREFRKRFWERDNLRLSFIFSPVNDLVGGYTMTLDRYSRDILMKNPLKQGGVVLHTAQITQLEEALLKRKGGGVLLVGEPGSGRRSVIYNFANRIAGETGPIPLRLSRVLELDMVTLIAAYPDRAVLASVVEKIFEEAIKAKNVILTIPGIDRYIGGRLGEERLASADISGIISRYLANPEFRFVGIADSMGYRQSIEPSGEIAAKLTKIEIPQASPDDAMRVLKEEVLRREGRSEVFVPIASLKEIVKLCDYFLASAAFPEKALNLLDDVVSSYESLAQKGLKTIAPADVDAFFTRKYNLPAGAAGEKEKEALLNLEERIHKGLINQKEAVSEIANALRRARARIKEGKRTIGNFLFLGPTGCGKTETAKQLADAYFGSSKNMIRLDMAEYQKIDSIDKLIGDQNTPGYLPAAVRKNPFSLILVDEIEKAHPGILNIFLSIFDEGSMTDGFGRKVDFRHTIVICTSNAGAERIKTAVENGESMASLKDKLIDQLLDEGVFKPEFINRFDAAVLYRPLNREESAQVARLMLEEVRNGLRQKRIEFEITSRLAEELARIGFDPVFGGRAMRRALQDKVENQIAKALLSGGLNPGDKFRIDPDSWQLVAVPAAI